MALTPRHKFCISKISECFSGSVDNSKVQSFIRRNENLSRLNVLFSGEGGAKVFVHYQRRNASSGDGGDPSGKDAQEGEEELFFSNGDSNYMSQRCCYFLRTTGSKPVDTAVANDKSLLYGEISESPLQTIEALLSGSFEGLFSKSAEWGKVRCTHAAYSQVFRHFSSLSNNEINIPILPILPIIHLLHILSHTTHYQQQTNLAGRRGTEG